ncbi:hypothetical protein [Serratia marcescens]|uniref:hypothetical protein n=1 Tax=Serratia marcescens TaxID=615 RepID=UPI00111C651A|nr:hypothetical protein [Serratia marcescens]UJA53685.1 hypothetical protein L1F17_22475 [Serratia marcescens]
MDTNTIVNLIIGGVIGWLSGHLPFVKKLDTDRMTKLITNVICGVVGGGAGAAAAGSIVESTEAVSLSSWPGLVGAIVGSGVLSTVSSIILDKIKR